MERNLFRAVLLLVGLFPIISFAAETFFHTPQVYLESMVGEELLGQGDIIVPVNLSNDRSSFLYGQVRASIPEVSDAFESFDHTPWTGSLGFGSRKIYGNRLLGAYLFGDYSGTSGGFNYWDVSPGVEALGKVWDFRANGYFPLGKKSWSKEDWADEFGNYDYVKYTGHKEYDRWAKYDHFQEVASGGDVEVGRKLFKQKNTLVKAYLGGYYFDMKDNKNILGASARITFQPSQFITFSVNDTYDKQYHNTLMLGMRVKLNDIVSLVSGDSEYGVTEDRDLSVRLLDPVERNLGSLASATSIPVSKGKMTAEGYGLEHDNIWFFGQAGSHMRKGHFQDVEDGTYEHPFDGFNQDNVNYVKDNYGHIGAVIDPFPLLYFAPGTYDLGVFGSSYRFALPGGWGMYGRTEGYIMPARGDKRALFIGGLDLFEGNNVLDSIRLENNTVGNSSQEGQQDIGINITGSNVYMNNISVGVLNNDEGYQTGIDITGATNVTLNGSQVYGYDSPSEGDASAYGIQILDSELTLGDGNDIEARATGGTGTSRMNGDAYGIYAGNSTVNISGSGNSISAEGTGGTSESDDAWGSAFGIYADSSTVNISGSGNSISAEATGGTGGYGKSTTGYASGIDTNYSTVNVSGNGNNIDAKAEVETANETVIANGITVTFSTLNISGSGNSINAEATGEGSGKGAYGIYGRYNSTVNFAHTAIDTTITVGGSTDTPGTGIYADHDSHLQIDGSDLNGSNLSNLETYITFANTGTGGKKIQWDGTGSINW